ncbi:zinc finger protein schnurri [Anticarsia gemmatalis]|uniref:zinc finger protein schnurri n=1 Tax=Anticarsia gemmatalis TaxID=129554 RepID=UPI003F75DB24
MPLTQEKRLDSNFANNNDHSYLHKKFKKMASTISVFPGSLSKAGDTRHKEAIVSTTAGSLSISNGSIAAAHPEIEKIKIKEDKQHLELHNAVKNVQINYNDENSRLGNVNNFVQVSGQTSFTDEFSNKTENLENDLIKDAYNGGVGGRYICPYCKLSCAKPSVLQKHIRAHTNERPYPCVPCGFAFKTKSNLYKHRRSRTHALRLQGADVSATLNDEDLSGGSESDTSIPPTSISETGSDVSIVRTENLESNDSTELTIDNMPSTSIGLLYSNDNSKSKSIYKPKFRAALYQESDDKDKVKKSISPNADFLTEHISKIISDNEAIVDVIETPLQKKYGKIKQIAESKQLADLAEIKTEPTPLNLTKSNHDQNYFRKRSHSESFSQSDHQKHPLNPEGSIIKDLLLKTKMNGLGPLTGELIDGPLFVCPLCQIIYRSADNLETHRMFYCKGNITNNAAQKDPKSARPDNVFVRSNSVNVRLPETSTNSFTRSNNSTKSSPSRIKPENLIIMKPETNDVVAPLPSPGPLLGNTRLVDTRVPSDYSRKNESLKVRPMASPKRRIDNRSDSYSPRLIENISPRSTDLYSQSKIRCIDMNASSLRSLDEISQHIKHNSTSLQMFGGEVKILDHSGSTTTLRIEPSKNQLSPILIQQNLSPSKLANDTEASSVVVRSGLHSGGTIMHNPPTPKEILGTPQPQTPRITISTATSISNSNLPNINDITHFQFPPLSAITAFNPLTLPPLSPSSPNGATTILHGGKLIPHVPGIPGPNTPGVYVGHSNAQAKNIGDTIKTSIPSTRDDAHGTSLTLNVQSAKAAIFKYETQQMRSSKSPNLRPSHAELDKHSSPQDSVNNEMPHYISPVPIIKIKNMDESNLVSTKTLVRTILRQDGALKRNSEGIPRTPVLKENVIYSSNKLKVNRDKLGSNLSPKIIETKQEKELRNFNYENLITKTEIYNNQIPSSSEVQKNTNAQETPVVSVQNERSETSYFQKNLVPKAIAEDRKPKFLRPSTLPLKPGTFTPKRHHGITPTANTMPLVSPETPRPAKAYGQLYLNGNAYTYLGLKCSTKVFYCTINRPQPTYVPNQEFLSMYSNWQLLSELTPDPLGLSASSAMSLYDSRHRPQNVAVAVIKQDLILTHSSQWNKISKECKQTSQLIDIKKSEENKFPICDNVNTPKKELTGGFESNEEYTYVRGRGRGRYVCSECGIRCKKPSMLKKHIRTHTDVRPYTCVHCAFSFKTKGNLTKHMKSKAHYKKCCELGINPNEGNDAEGGEMAQCSGETDDDTDSEGDEGNEGETESSDTEAYKSRLPEHEAAHCLLSLGGTRPTTSATPGLITSARPTTYPYTPIDMENVTAESSQEMLSSAKCSTIESRISSDNEPMDLSKSDIKPSTPNIPEIPTARESSVLASLASNTAKAKLPNHQAQWSNGEPMLHTYLTERALLDSKIKQSQLTSSLSKVRKIDLEKTSFTDSYSSMDSKSKTVTSVKSSITTPASVCQVTYTESKITDVNEPETVPKPVVSKEEIPTTRESPSTNSSIDVKANVTQPSISQNNAENAKHVVSEYLKHARINLIKTHEDNQQSDTMNDESNTIKINNEDTSKAEENVSESETIKLPSLDHDPVARKVVIGVGGVAFKVTKGKDFDNSSYSPGRLMEDGRRVCDFCNKTFTKPSQLRLHLNIHYMERPFRCSVCAVSFRTRGHLQKHERSGSHHNKVSMTSTFGAATSFNPRPFRCSDCNIAFRIHGHLAKHLRSKMHVMRLECLFKLPFGTFTEIERAGVSLTDIDTTDCASSLASLQSLARKLHEKDPTKLEYREPNGSSLAGPPAGRESSEDEDSVSCENICESERDSEVKTIECNEGQDKDTRVNYSATDI